MRFLLFQGKMGWEGLIDAISLLIFQPHPSADSFISQDELEGRGGRWWRHRYRAEGTFPRLVNLPSSLERADWNMFANIRYLPANCDCLLVQKWEKKGHKSNRDTAKTEVGLQRGFPRFKLSQWGHFLCMKNNTISTCYATFRLCVPKVFED